VDGSLDTAQFWEPGGLAFDEQRNLLYVADTNNHAIRVVQLGERSVATLPITKAVSQELRSPESIRLIRNRKRATIVDKGLDDVVLGRSMEVQLNLEQSLQLTDGTPSQYQVTTNTGQIVAKGILEKGMNTISLKDNADDNAQAVELEALVYFCGSDGVCRMRSFVFAHDLTDEQYQTSRDVISL